jgi:diguanylate cyclase (GGDEF)-like protein/PAS domain S-box-containing protein
MFKKKSIKTKLLTTFLLIGILSITITGFIFYLNAESTLKKVHFNHLTSIRETKKRQVETYFDQVRNQIITFSEDQMIIDAMKRFRKAFYEVKKGNEFNDSKISQYISGIKDYYDEEFLTRLNANMKEKRGIVQYWPENAEAIILQYHYIVNNPNPTGSKGNLEMATDGSQYSRIHSKYHPIILDYQKRFGYYDIFLVDAQTGDIVYSVFKEVDYATNLLAGPYKDTNFARVFREARNTPDKEFVKLVDFEFYDPSYADPASFIASPIFDGDKKIGVLVFQVPADEINQVMTGNYNWGNEGLGESGETYIAGSDYKMRNDSRFIIEEPDRYFELIEQIGTDKEVINQIKSHSTSIMFQEIRTDAVGDALNGNTNTKIIDNYRGIPVLSSYTPLSIEDVNWVMLSEIDKEEAFASLDVIRNRIVFITLIISTIIAIIAFFISKKISIPILQLAKGMDDISKGDFSRRVNIASKDEIGNLANSFNKMTDNLVGSNVKEEKAVEELKHSNEELSKSHERLEIEIAEHKQSEVQILKLSHAIEQGPTAVVITDVKGNIEYVNHRLTEMTGYSQEEAIGKNPRILKSGEQGPEVYKKLWDSICSGGEWQGELHNKRKNGELYWEFSSISPVKDREGIITHFIAVKEDITARKRLEQLQKNTMEERELTIRSLKNLMEFSSIMREEIQEAELIKHMAHILKEDFNLDVIVVLMLNREKDILDVPLIEPQMPAGELIKPETFLNPSICRVLRTGDVLIVRDVNKDIPCECLSLKIKEGGYACYPLITGGITTGVVLMIKKERDFWDSEEKQSLFSTYVGLVASALHRVRLMDMTRHAAVTDGLTGVYNRRFFDETLEKQILLEKRRKKPLSLLIMDIDHFKNFNDSYGHIAGDRALKQLTINVSDAIRESDILARYGGEEFVVIMPETDLSNARKKADKIRWNVESMNLDNIVSGQSLKMTISIGVASFPEHGTEFNTLVASADGALYKAKESGRNRVEVPKNVTLG